MFQQIPYGNSEWGQSNVVHLTVPVLLSLLQIRTLEPKPLFGLKTQVAS